MIKEWQTPAWDNDEKTRLIAILVTKDENGQEKKSTATVNKFDSNGKVSQDWSDILEIHGVKGVDKGTEARMAFRKEKERKQRRADEERRKSEELQRLFNSKLACFEIEEVKNSKNTKLRRKIRKSKNEIELMTYTSVLVMKEYAD